MICGVFSASFSLMTRITFSVLKRYLIKSVSLLFLREKGVALYDTASCVRRLQDNASDKFLEVVSPTDIGLLLQQPSFLSGGGDYRSESDGRVLRTDGSKRAASGRGKCVSFQRS